MMMMIIIIALFFVCSRVYSVQMHRNNNNINYDLFVRGNRKYMENDVHYVLYQNEEIAYM
jgi:hypothetical protein